MGNAMPNVYCGPLYTITHMQDNRWPWYIIYYNGYIYLFQRSYILITLIFKVYILKYIK